jgi:hypothetical protein
VLFADGAGGVLLLLLWVFCIFDAISADETRVRNLSKGTWIILVILLADIGSVMWLVAGRPQGPARTVPYKGNTGIPPEYDRPGRAVAQTPDDDAAFLEGLKRRAEEQRRRAEEDAKRLRDQDDGGSQA